MKLYVTCHPSREMFARGLAAAEQDEDCEVTVEVRDDCPPDRCYVTGQPVESFTTKTR